MYSVTLPPVLYFKSLAIYRTYCIIDVLLCSRCAWRPCNRNENIAEVVCVKLNVEVTFKLTQFL